MSSLISDSQKASLVADFSSLVDTFVRPLIAYKEAQKIVISTDPNFNRLNRFDQNQTKIQNAPVYQTINARIYYNKNIDNPYGDINGKTPSSQLKLRMPDGAVRIKVDAAGFAYIGQTKRIELDGNLFEVASVERPHGLFGVEYYTYWLTRLQ